MTGWKKNLGIMNQSSTKFSAGEKNKILFGEKLNLYPKIIINVFYQAKFKIAAKYTKRRQEKLFIQQ